MDVIVTFPLSEGREYFWEKIKRSRDPAWEVEWNFRPYLPKDLETGNKLFMVFDGRIRGYFIVDYLHKFHFGDGDAIIKDWVQFQYPPVHRGFRNFFYVRPEMKFKWRGTLLSLHEIVRKEERLLEIDEGFRRASEKKKQEET